MFQPRSSLVLMLDLPPRKDGNENFVFGHKEGLAQNHALETPAATPSAGAHSHGWARRNPRESKRIGYGPSPGTDWRSPDPLPPPAYVQIGRASCRERV